MSGSSPIQALHDSGDPLLPPPPKPSYFDPALGAWVLSRYEEVLAAFRDPRLWPVGASDEGKKLLPDEVEHERMRAETMAALSFGKLAEWQTQMEMLARRFAGGLATDRPVDLVREFAEPWGLAVAAIVTGVDPADTDRLASLARPVSQAAADPDDADLRTRATAANAELERSFQTRLKKMGAPAFVALSQTMPRLLANIWLALLRHPTELMLLREEPGLISSAIDELLRYAALPRILFRRATSGTTVGGIRIAEGERAVLLIASANRDPAQFREPDRLAIKRRGAGQLGLGAGSHSCVGGPLIRTTAAAATSVFVELCADSEITGSLEWRGGAVFRSPASLTVRLRAPEPGVRTSLTLKHPSDKIDE